MMETGSTNINAKSKVLNFSAFIHIYVKLSNGLNDGNRVDQHQCEVIKNPENTQDPAGIRTEEFLITLTIEPLDLLWQRSVEWMLIS